MASSLVGKVALITAGSAGLGAAIASKLAAAQMRIVINYASNSARATELVKSLSDALPPTETTSEPRFIAIQADLAKRADIVRLVEESVRAMGRLDVVVSNGGWTRFSNFNNLDEGVIESDWDQCFNMNVKSHLFLMHASKEHLEATEGALITTSSVASVKPSGSSLVRTPTTAVSKAAQIHLVKALAMIVSPKVRVNSISPGILLTVCLHSLFLQSLYSVVTPADYRVKDWGMKFSEEHLAAAKEKTLLKRFATVEDCAEQVLTFAKSKSVTGQNAVIDSGFSI
ncbi:putative oxidoreductase 1 [Hyphodiscus hymeniophilus]|uniref:Oxidoreductase 1 n=1 Tax=Hyphodiscus hymeniophilus TaxID=353542 RepID=A0A9P6VC46_9HELO|nr:putative oxidoreductase 1 [Hyphodiscus hymeniophilus]